MLDLLKGIVAPILGPLLDKIPDPNERRRLEAQAEENLLNAMTGLVQGQLAINQKEAEHSSIFVAGWRPWIGWVCGMALAWNFLVQPLILWGAFLIPSELDLASAPQLEVEGLYPLIFGMLGMGGLRTYEKRLGVARSGLGKNSSN